MDNRNYIHVPDLSSLTKHFTINQKTSPISFFLSTPLNSTTTSSLDSIQSHKIYTDNLVITQPTINKSLSHTIKQEELEKNSLHETYSIINRSKTKFNQLPPPTVVTAIHLNPRETLNGLSTIPMTSTSSHLMSTLNPAHLPDGTGSYFVSGLTDLASNYKMNPSSNTDLPSPSSSSNSSNPPSSNHRHHHQHHPTRRHGEGGDPTRKREMRLQKNREAARECRRKKKEYIKCLEERVAGLEAQNKALIEELRQLKELYCQREDTSKPNSKTTATTR